MLKIAVVGAAGRMGQALVHTVTKNPFTALSGVLEREGHPLIGKDAGTTAGLDKLGVKIKDSAEKAFKEADCLIDFSTPEATLAHLELAAEEDKAIIIGTTGLSHHQRERVKELGEETRVVMAPNMSVGINLLLKLVELTASVLGDDYDVEIIESHHRHKKDAPSGTALRIAEVAAHALGRTLEEDAIYSRKGIIGERKPSEIGIQTIRAGDIVGDHTIMFATPGERIELTHKAQSRDTFAKGAVRAALWLSGKPAGLYDMQDVLGLKE
ncbi:MAG: 4-hydroxy-tetrahydrodipicolinate reductase [Thermodesulfobacteriota bacterium]